MEDVDEKEEEEEEPILYPEAVGGQRWDYYGDTPQPETQNLRPALSCFHWGELAKRVLVAL